MRAQSSVSVIDRVQMMREKDGAADRYREVGSEMVKPPLGSFSAVQEHASTVDNKKPRIKLPHRHRQYASASPRRNRRYQHCRNRSREMDWQILRLGDNARYGPGSQYVSPDASLRERSVSPHGCSPPSRKRRCPGIRHDPEVKVEGSLSSGPQQSRPTKTSHMSWRWYVACVLLWLVCFWFLFQAALLYRKCRS